MKIHYFLASILCMCMAFSFFVYAETSECMVYAEKASLLQGDINSDGEIGTGDVSLLLRNFLFPNIYSLEYRGEVDFNRDGAFDEEDVLILMKHSLSPEKYPVGFSAGVMDQAVYLIDDGNFSKERYDGHGSELIHGWNVDNRGSSYVNKYAEYNGAFTDSYDDSSVSMYKYITPVSEGRLTLETQIFLGDAHDGFEIGFYDDKNCVVKLFTEGGYFGLLGNGKKLSGKNVSDGSAKIKIELDLDKMTASLYLGSRFACRENLCDFDNINKISIGTSEEGKLVFAPERVALYMNYAVNDTFMLFEEGEVLSGYETSGSVRIAENYSGSNDSISAKMIGKSLAKRNFGQLGYGFVTEVYLIQDNISAKSAISVGDIKLEMHDGIYSVDGRQVATYNENVWQCVRFERLPDSSNICIRICGKDVYEYESNKRISSFTIQNQGGTLWFDDVKCFSIYDFDDYVPEPAETEKKTDVTVCMSVCSLWHEGTHYGWDYVSAYDELIPVLGFYDEGLPETADWEIKYMVESGIDALQPCWYASTITSPMKEPRLNKYAIHDGYFNAKYKDKLDFCIMWENQSVKSGLTLENFKKYLWNYWVDWYFKDPGYMCFDNKPVLTIYQYETFVSAFGSAEKAREAVDFMREDIKKYGYDGLILLFNMYTADQANSIDEKALADGIELDGLLPYHWGVNAYDPETIKSHHKNGYTGKGDNPIVATASTGRNIIGWEQTRSPIATYEQHLEALEYLTDELLPLYEDDFGKGSWQSKLIFLGTWNEFAEGHWLMPTGINGKGPGQDYMNAWKEVFVDSPSELVIPTENQKDRISYLYPAVNTPIRAELIDTKAESPDDNSQIVADFDFATSEYAEFSYSRFDEVRLENGVFYGVAESESTKTDPLFVVKKAFSGINTDDVDVIHIRMKASTSSSVCVYPLFEGDTSYTESKRLDSRYDSAGEWQDIYIETKDYSSWHGTIKNIRFDLLNGVYGTLECDIIELLAYKDEGFGINVDGIRLDINSQYIMEEDGEVYVAALPTEGFYPALGICHEWHRFDKKLFLVMGVGENETTFEFEVGSDICLVNGMKKMLDKEFYLFDEVPVIPAIFLLEEAGIMHEYSEGKLLYVNVRSEEYSEDESLYAFDFDIPDDYCGFAIKRAKAFVYDGALHLFPQKQSSGSFDPIIAGSSITPFFASDCKTITVRMKYTLTDKTDETASMYFNTDKNSSFAESRSIKRKLSSGQYDGDGYYIYEFDMTECANYTGKISALRFDVANCDGKFVIDYIKINFKE